MDTSEARRRRAEELSLRYHEKCEAFGVQHDPRTSYQTGYFACLNDMLEKVVMLEAQIMDMIAEREEGRLITYTDGPNLKVTRPN